LFGENLEGTAPAVPKFFGRAGARSSKGWQNWRAHLLMRREFSAVREHCPPEKLFSTRHLLLAAVLPVANRRRHSPSFGLGRSLALPIHSVPRPASLAPF